MRAIFILFFITVIIWGCSEKDNSSADKKPEQYQEKLTLVPQEVKSFTLNATTSAEKSYAEYYRNPSNGKEYLYLLNYLTRELQIFDWLTASYLSGIKLEKEGPNGVGNPYAYLIKSPDSIFIMDGVHFKLTLINSSGKALKSYRLYHTTADPTIGAGLLPRGESPMTIIDNKLYIDASPFDDWKIERYYAHGRIGLVVDINTSKLESLLPIPESFVERHREGMALTSQQAHFKQAVNVKKKQVVFNFMTENDIYVLDLTDKKVRTFYAGSKDFTTVEYPKIKILADMRAEGDFFVSQRNFTSILFCPEQKVYLRFLATPNKARVKKFDPGSTIPYFTHSAIILDENFVKVGEAPLNKEQWGEGRPIVTSTGIYVEKSSDDESKLEFRHYQVSSVADRP